MEISVTDLAARSYKLLDNNEFLVNDEWVSIEDIGTYRCPNAPYDLYLRDGELVTVPHETVLEYRAKQ